MKTNTKKTVPSEPNPTTTTAKPCIFTPADRERLKPLLAKDSFDALMALSALDPMLESLIDADGEEIDNWAAHPISINYWHDEGEEHIYQIGENVYAYRDHRSDFLVYEEADVTCVIEYSYPCEDGYWEERCVGFDVEPSLHLVELDHDGPCRVWVKTFYHDDHTRPEDRSGWVRGDKGEIINFKSYLAASRWITKDNKSHHGYADIREPEGYYLKKTNEYAPREYKICE